jgi:hypothetical protein
LVFTDESTADLVGSGYSFRTDANIVTISHTAKQEGLHIQWRAYMLKDLQFETEIAADLDRPECWAFRRVFVPFVCKYPWGAISTAIIGCLLNSIELTVPRIEGVLRFWEPLDTLKYVDLHERPISLAQLMIDCFEGNIAMWVDQPTGNVRADLQAACDQMRNAPEEEIRSRLIKRLRAQVDIKKELQHREWLKSPGIIEAGLEAERQLGQHWYDNLTGGQTSELGRFLRDLDKNHSTPMP